MPRIWTLTTCNDGHIGTSIYQTEVDAYRELARCIYREYDKPGSPDIAKHDALVALLDGDSVSEAAMQAFDDAMMEDFCETDSSIDNHDIDDAIRAKLKERFPWIDTDEEADGSDAVDALTEWWADLGGEWAELDGEIKPTPEEGEERYACQNCEWTGAEDELAVIDGLYKGRILPGEPMPPGQCPECGALAQEVE